MAYASQAGRARTGSEFYVYEHWRPDLDQCFYVWKGRKRRAWKMFSRNKFHTAICQKLKRNGLAIDVRVIARDLTEEEAFTLEKDKIAGWRAAGIELANVGCGGDGQSGLIAWNRKRVICLETGAVYESTFQAAEALDLAPITVLDVCTEKYRSAKGWHFIYSEGEISEDERKRIIQDIEMRLAARRRRGVRRPEFGVNLGRDKLGRSAAGPMSLARRVVCLDDQRSYASASEAGRAYDVNKSAIIELCLGKNGRKSVGGYRFAYEAA